jgi:hypothetical protein
MRGSRASTGARRRLSAPCFGALGRSMAGQADAYDELRARRCLMAVPSTLARVCREHVSVSVASPATSLSGSDEADGRSKMRFIGAKQDAVHRDRECQVRLAPSCVTLIAINAI